MKLESLVIANQNVAVNTFRVLYTPPVTPWESEMPEAGDLTLFSVDDEVAWLLILEQNQQHA